ncbi:hypothetical protein BD626DRAFT_494196 [Schizophyllum amplum]|uniref:Uncharacterized protein n=1 Tax=Schizophyllum amplum TaxID=97359 RepID=A0A550CEZ5_9AGAR|nr:hypothetical protein BD626DRAFT_494196 [Auriculariopsis ampla]
MHDRRIECRTDTSNARPARRMHDRRIDIKRGLGCGITRGCESAKTHLDLRRPAFLFFHFATLRSALVPPERGAHARVVERGAHVGGEDGEVADVEGGGFVREGAVALEDDRRGVAEEERGPEGGGAHAGDVFVGGGFCEFVRLGGG